MTPGELLRQILKDKGLKQTDLCRATGYTPKHVNRVIMGHHPLTPEMALALEEALDHEVTAEMWCHLQTRKDLAALRARTDYGR